MGVILEFFLPVVGCAPSTIATVLSDGKEGDSSSGKQEERTGR